ncbi:MAG: ROK family protein [Clostridia bacterium]|nr:ROK family protein [Deltaproteobacteria bacterium]
MSKAIAVDLGGTNVRVALVDAKGNVEQFARDRVTDKSPEAIAAQTARLIVNLEGADTSLGISMTVPSSVWTNTGKVANAPNLGWRDVAFGPILEKAAGLKVRLLNDLNAITYGEAMVGGGRRERDVACVFIGTGIGVGAVCDGTLLEGADGLAPEIGHIKYVAPAHGRQCGCGQRGCIEAYVGGTHLPALLREIRDNGTPSMLLDQRQSDWQTITSKDIEDAGVAGDEAAKKLWNDIAERGAWVLGLVIMAYNPRVIILGGGVLQSAPNLAKSVDDNLRQYAWSSFLENVRVVQTELGDNAGIIGAGLSGHAHAKR